MLISLIIHNDIKHSGSGILPTVSTPNLSSNTPYECPLNYICPKCGVPGHYVQDCTGAATAMTPMLHNPSQLQSALNAQNATTLQQLGANGMNGMGSLNGLSSNPSLNGLQQLNQTIQQQQQHSMSSMGGMNGGQSSSKNPPPANYVCHKCNVVGHWIQECPLNTQQQQDYTKPPPANYVCHRCGIPGHWIKNCPTNGNPTFDNKPHLKVIKQQDGTTTVINTNTVNGQGSNEGSQQNQNNGDASTNSNVTTASQPPSKKRRLNQM